ncbi:hypothetical protein HPB49_020636 [Dermacentor silvarum]|uniref:Uncharacterized protein n=1 Tax=Dermacentor silvarum TaxID=543639 RepID=A0ACB8DR89_DERSI|nr:hypothetical protein HPB49_020636 [Dermacentor silvarum]
MTAKHSELRNEVIRAACLDIPHFRPADNKPNCNSWQTDVIFDAMKFYNVTVVQTFYASPSFLIKDMFYARVDIHRNLGAGTVVGARDTYLPGLILYWYESFYAKRNGPVMLSFYKLLQESNVCLALVSVTLMFALLFFMAADLDRVRSWRMNSTVDSFTFLVAVLYSTSYSIPHIGRWTGLCGFVCSLWLVGMLPFSNYFRGELASRVTLQAFPEHLDTLAKLERALDEKRVAPCVLKDSFVHQRIAGVDTVDNIQQKLRLAFKTHEVRGELVQRSWWFKHPYKRSIVESRERLNPILLTNAVRKNYPHRAAYRDLVGLCAKSKRLQLGCAENGSKQITAKHSELRNEVIRAACLDIPHFRPADNKPNCNSWQTDVFFDALKFYNVTVVQTFYASSSLLIKDMFYARFDIHRNLGAATVVGARDAYLPGLVMYWYESFYAKRNGPVMLSFYKLLQESKLCLALVSVTLMFALLFFVAADFDRLRSWRMNSTVDSFTFLVAVLYSTSYSIPQIGRWTGLCGFVCSLWLLGMLPFSNYFRGELTSRVTLRDFPEHLDTLAKLERALDEKRVAPCVVKDSFVHQRIARNDTVDNIKQKLRLAFKTHEVREKLVQRSWVHCLQCALREDRICLAVSFPQWFKHPYKRSIVESRERTYPVFLTNAVRKNYPHRAAYRDLLHCSFLSVPASVAAHRWVYLQEVTEEYIMEIN